MKRILFQVLFIVISLASYSQDNINPADTGYWYVDEQASFQGGDINTFSFWIMEHIGYPVEAYQEGCYGRVIIQFSVDRKGNICDVKVINKTHQSLVTEAERVLYCSPRWTPAKIKGRPVKQNFVIPIGIDPQ